MNPALPVGGSALDAVTARQGDDPQGVTTVALAMQWAKFGRHHAGSQEVSASDTDELDVLLSDISLRRHLPSGLTIGLRVPVGSVRVQPTGGTARQVAGFGDIELSTWYDVSQHWRKGRRPRLVVSGTLALPTGEARRVEDVSPDVPPNLVAIGSAAFGVGFQAQLTQPITTALSARLWAGVRTPLQYGDTDVRFGVATTGGVGAIYNIGQKALLSADVFGVHRTGSRNRDVGRLINSGGSSAFADVGITVLATPRFAFGATGRVPLYMDVNGVQITQSYSVMGLVAFTFGEAPHEHGSLHDEHAEEGEDHDSHDHGDDAEGHDGHHHESGDHQASGEYTPDVADLATGGDTFTLESARVPGKRVAIDFWADWCEPCKEVEKILREHAAHDPGFAVRKVEVPDFRTPVGQEHLADQNGLPIVWLLDEHGRVIRKLNRIKPAALRKALGH